ncbi:Alanine racemase [Hyphomicrobiales bacterium]|nr:Alanine racemase [Hyphomicrobiales bacterium]CAH1690869.1 Alanine racemase [Hyphomicrobiales bacterium]
MIPAFNSPASGPAHHRPTWCEIDLDAIEHNFKFLRRLVGPDVKIFACTKGNAGGCGFVGVATFLESVGADGIAVGNVDDAMAIRRAGGTLPILLYPSCLPMSARALAANRLMPTISTLDDVEAWSAQAQGPLEVFLKLDGGGLRVGALPVDAIQVAQAVMASRHLRLAGVYAHPVTSGNFDTAGYYRPQIDTIVEVLKQLDAAGIVPPIRMVASSEIILSYPEVDFNAVDPGRLFTGTQFPAVKERQGEWRSAFISLKSRIVMKKPLHDLSGIAFVPNFFPRRENMIIGLIPIGWCDGYPRVLPEGAYALVKGKRVPILGPVHSELLRIDLTDVPDADVGEEVVLLGRSGGAEITLEELSVQWNVPQGIVRHSIRAHVPRLYLRGQA